MADEVARGAERPRRRPQDEPCVGAVMPVKARLERPEVPAPREREDRRGRGAIVREVSGKVVGALALAILAGCASLDDVGTARVPAGTTFVDLDDGTFADGKERATSEVCLYRNPATGEVAMLQRSTESGGLEALAGMLNLQMQLETARAAERRAFASEVLSILDAYGRGLLLKHGDPSRVMIEAPDDEPEPRAAPPIELPQQTCFPWSKGETP